MTDAFKGNRTESALDWAASLIFAALVGYACWMVGGTKLAALGTAAAFMAGAGVLSKVAPGHPVLPAFDVEPFDDTASMETEELLLDDPLGTPDEGSRVVALFAPVEHAPAALVARIEDYLGRDAQRGSPRQAGRETPTVDASAALHAALSNIRASLR